MPSVVNSTLQTAWAWKHTSQNCMGGRTVASRRTQGTKQNQNMLAAKLEVKVCVCRPQGRLACRATGTTGRRCAKVMKPRLNLIMPLPFVMPPSAGCKWAVKI